MCYVAACTHTLSLVFVIGPGNFATKKQFISAVIEEFEVGKDSLQLAIVYYDNAAYIALDFDEQRDKDQTKIAITAVNERLALGDRYSEGLKKASEMLAKISRDDVKVIRLCLTDIIFFFVSSFLFCYVCLFPCMFVCLFYICICTWRRA